MYLTEVNHEFKGDTFFPEFDEKIWDIEYKSDEMFDKNSELYYTFINYLKKSKLLP